MAYKVRYRLKLLYWWGVLEAVIRRGRVSSASARLRFLAAMAAWSAACVLTCPAEETAPRPIGLVRSYWTQVAASAHGLGNEPPQAGASPQLAPGHYQIVPLPPKRQVRILIQADAAAEAAHALEAFALQQSPWTRRAGAEDEEAPAPGIGAVGGRLELNWLSAAEARVPVSWPDLSGLLLALPAGSPAALGIRVEVLEDEPQAQAWEYFRQRMLQALAQPGATALPEAAPAGVCVSREETVRMLPGGHPGALPPDERDLFRALASVYFSQHWLEEAPLAGETWVASVLAPLGTGETWALPEEDEYRLLPDAGELAYTVEGPGVLELSTRARFRSADLTPFIEYRLEAHLGSDGARTWTVETRPDQLQGWRLDAEAAPIGRLRVRRMALPPGRWALRLKADRSMWTSVRLRRQKPRLAEALSGAALAKTWQQAQQMLQSRPASPWRTYGEALSSAAVAQGARAAELFAQVRDDAHAPAELRRAAGYRLARQLVSEGAWEKLAAALETFQALPQASGAWGEDVDRAARTLAIYAAPDYPAALDLARPLLEHDARDPRVHEALTVASLRDPAREGARPGYIRHLWIVRDARPWDEDVRWSAITAWDRDTYWRDFDADRIDAREAQRTLRPAVLYRGGADEKALSATYPGVMGRLDDDYFPLPPDAAHALAAPTAGQTLRFLAVRPQSGPAGLRLDLDGKPWREWGLLEAWEPLAVRLPPEVGTLAVGGAGGETQLYAAGASLALPRLGAEPLLGWRPGVFHRVGTPSPVFRMDPSDTEGFIRATLRLTGDEAPPRVRISLDGKLHRELRLLPDPQAATASGERFFTWDFAVPPETRAIGLEADGEGLWVQLAQRRRRSENELGAPPAAGRFRPEPAAASTPAEREAWAADPASAWTELARLSELLQDGDAPWTNRVEWLRRRASLLTALLAPTRARSDLERALDFYAPEDPERCAVLLDQAELEQEWGAAEDAALCLEALRKLDCYGPRIALGLGLWYLQQGESEFAEAHFREASHDPQAAAQAALGLALLLEEREALDEAAEALARARAALIPPGRAYRIALRLQARLAVRANRHLDAAKLLEDGLAALRLRLEDGDASFTLYQEIERLEKLAASLRRLDALRTGEASAVHDLALGQACEAELFAAPVEHWRALEPYALEKYPAAPPCYLERSERFYLYYAVQGDADLVFSVRGPARVRLAVRPDHPLENGRVLPAEPLRLAVYCAGIGPIRRLIVGSRTSDQVRYPVDLKLAPGRRINIEFEVPPGKRSVRVSTLAGSAHVRPLVLEPRSDESLLPDSKLNARDAYLRAALAPETGAPEDIAARLAARVSMGLEPPPEDANDPALWFAAGRFDRTLELLTPERARSREDLVLRGRALLAAGRFEDALDWLPEGEARSDALQGRGEELAAAVMRDGFRPLDERILSALNCFERLPASRACDPQVERLSEALRQATVLRSLSDALGDVPLHRVILREAARVYESTGRAPSGTQFHEAMVMPQWRETGLLLPVDDLLRLDLISTKPFRVALQLGGAPVFYGKEAERAGATLSVLREDQEWYRHPVRLDRVETLYAGELPAGAHRLRLGLDYDAQVWRVRARLLTSIPLAEHSPVVKLDGVDWYALPKVNPWRYARATSAAPLTFQVAGPTQLRLRSTSEGSGTYAFRVRAWREGHPAVAVDHPVPVAAGERLEAEIDGRATQLSLPHLEDLNLSERTLYRVEVAPEGAEALLLRVAYRTLAERGQPRGEEPDAPAAPKVEPAPTPTAVPAAPATPDLPESPQAPAEALPPSTLSQALQAPVRDAEAVEDTGNGQWSAFSNFNFEDAKITLDDQSYQDWFGIGFGYDRRIRENGPHFGATVQGRWLQDSDVPVGDFELTGFVPLPVAERFYLSLQAEGHVQEDGPGIPASGSVRARLGKSWKLPKELEFRTSLELGAWGSTLSDPNDTRFLAYEVYNNFADDHPYWLTPRARLTWAPFRDLEVYSEIAARTNNDLNPGDLDRWWVHSGLEGYQHGFTWSLRHTYLARLNDDLRGRASHENRFQAKLSYDSWAAKSFMLQPFISYEQVFERDSHSLFFGLRVILGKRDGRPYFHSAPGLPFRSEREYLGPAP
ncbi:MAG: hypothetical protein HS116_20195 [Planctomycetes bacterium]|nr:hypothetical protein [Planctomycetota bacterium]